MNQDARTETVCAHNRRPPWEARAPGPSAIAYFVLCSSERETVTERQTTSGAVGKETQLNRFLTDYRCNMSIPASTSALNNTIN